MKDDSPDAFAKVVDRLLASPALRRALGPALARPGPVRREPRLRARLRPARRLPLPRLRHRGAERRTCRTTQFVKWQLAGDEFAPNDPLALMATGFLAAGVHSTQITKNEVEKQRYDELDDMLATTGTAMLGLTVGCARCHDHKYDPIPQRDYYRLLSDVHDHGPQRGRRSTSTPRGIGRRRREFDAEHAPLVKARWPTTRRRNCRRGSPSGRRHQAGKPVPPAWVCPGDGGHEVGGRRHVHEEGRRQRARRRAEPDRESYSRSPLETDLKASPPSGSRRWPTRRSSRAAPGRAANGNFALTDLTRDRRAQGREGRSRGRS